MSCASDSNSLAGSRFGKRGSGAWVVLSTLGKRGNGAQLKEHSLDNGEQQKRARLQSVSNQLTRLEGRKVGATMSTGGVGEQRAAWSRSAERKHFEMSKILQLDIKE